MDSSRQTVADPYAANKPFPHLPTRHETSLCRDVKIMSLGDQKRKYIQKGVNVTTGILRERGKIEVHLKIAFSTS